LFRAELGAVAGRARAAAYISFGLSGSLAEEWLERPQVLAAALAALMTSHQWDKVEQKLNCLRVIAKEEDQRRQFLLKRAVDVYLPLKKEEERARYEAALASAVSNLSRLYELLEVALEARSLAQFEAAFEPGAPGLPS